MEGSHIQQLTETFEGHSQQTENGIEYWLARDLQQLLGYAEWRNFSQTAISKAKTACEVSGHRVPDHFVDVNKMIQLAKGAEREIDDLMLTRCRVNRRFPASTSPTTRQSAKRCWIAVSDRKPCLPPKTSRKSNGD